MVGAVQYTDMIDMIDIWYIVIGERKRREQCGGRMDKRQRERERKRESNQIIIDG